MAIKFIYDAEKRPESVTCRGEKVKAAINRAAEENYLSTTTTEVKMIKCPSEGGEK